MEKLPWIPDSETRKYTYPINLSTIEEWRALQTLDEKIEACRIPDDLINQLSTEDLLSLALEYPLNMNLFLYNSIQQGLNSIMNYNHCLSALYQREDALELMRFIYSKIAAVQQQDSNQRIKQRIFDSFIAGLDGTFQKESAKMVSLGPSVYVNTPNSSKVAVFDQSAETELSDREKENLTHYIMITYSGVEIVSGATLKYNCHSYAWYKQDSDNTMWMNDPSKYWEDGSYQYKGNSSTSVFQKVFYPDAGEEHSGIVYDSSNNIILSKWGQCPLVKHHRNNCPYVHGFVNRTLNYYA